MIKICFGCGCKLQYNDKEKEGYIPENKIANSVYCQRCFKIMHYGEQSVSSVPKNISTIINSINNDDKYVVFLVDFLSINTELVNIFNRIRKNKMLVISKCDIIPRSIKEHTIKDYLKENYEIDSPIKMISSYNNYGINSLMNYLSNNRIKECYVLGLSNSGKSTFINKLIELNDSNMHHITTSYIPNTTLDFIRINISEDLLIIDSPGFIIDTINTPAIVKKNNIKSFIKPKTFQMKAGEILSIEDMFIKVNRDTSFTLYMSNDLIAKKYYKEIPEGNKINIKHNNDLVIAGLGFINVKKACELEVVNIASNLMETRTSIFGDHYEQN